MESNTTPLWKRLNEERSGGTWEVINGFDEKGEGQYFPSLVMGEHKRSDFYKCPMVTFNESHDQKPRSIMANVNYTALAVNNLAKLAEALAGFIHSVEHEGEIHGRIVDAIRNAKEALKAIS